MTDVRVRELNQNTAGVLARVKQGEQVDITERGEVVARLIPAHEHPLSAMITSGKLHPATINTDAGMTPRPVGPVQTEQEAGQLLRELRDAERY